MKCRHEAWEESLGGDRKCADCRESLSPETSPVPDFQIGDRVSVEGVVERRVSVPSDNPCGDPDMTDHEFLSWIADRLVFVYHESPNVDFVQRLRRIVAGLTPKCGARTGATGMFVCTQPEGHDGNHRMDGADFSVSWPQVPADPCHHCTCAYSTECCHCGNAVPDGEAKP